MSINNDIITALSELDVPVFPDFYDSKIDRYDESGNKLQRLNEWMTFNNVSDTPSMFADDEDIFYEALFDIHFYSPNGKTAVEMKKKIIIPILVLVLVLLTIIITFYLKNLNITLSLSVTFISND